MEQKEIAQEKLDIFMGILSDIYGSDIAYYEKPETIKLILKAMEKAYQLSITLDKNNK